MATPQQNGEGENDPLAENIVILESIDVLTAQLKENLLKAEEERQKRAETPEESSDAVLWKQREEIAELKQANASAKGRIDAMKTHYHRLAKDTESQVNKLQEQLKGYEEAKKIADKDTQKRIVEANALKKKAAGAGELQKRIGELEKRCEGHKAVEDELERTKKELESEKKERAFLQRKVEDFETRTKQLENWEKIQEDLARALSARDEYKRRCQELEAAKSTGGKK
ncbi:hypothetical protein V8E51_004941 [Hyaloscypha variabilis]